MGKHKLKGNFCTDAEIKKMYKLLDKKEYMNMAVFIAKKDMFVLLDGDQLFLNSWRGRGIHLFTDEERAVKYLDDEKNATPNCQIGLMTYEEAMMYPYDIFVNKTPVGDQTVYFMYEMSTESARKGMQDREGRYTLPYGLTPSWQKRGLFR